MGGVCNRCGKEKSSIKWSPVYLRGLTPTGTQLDLRLVGLLVRCPSEEEDTIVFLGLGLG